LAGEIDAQVSWVILTCGTSIAVNVAKQGLKQGLENSLKNFFEMKFVAQEEIAKRLPGRLENLVAGEALEYAGAGKLLGIEEGPIQEIAELSLQEDIIISGRYRHPRAIQLLKVNPETGEPFAIVKSEQMKLKTISDIDVDFLLYDEEDLAAVSFKKDTDIQLLSYDQTYLEKILGETNEEQLIQKIRSIPKPEGVTRPGTGGMLTDADWQQALSAYEYRVTSYRKHLAEMKAWNDAGQVEFKFRYAQQGIPADDAVSIYQFRIDEQGRVLVKKETENVWKRITGDFDLVDIANRDGSQLVDVAKRKRVLDRLKKIADIQHGDTASWIADETKRQAFFDAHKPGGEPLIQFGFDGKVRVTYIDTNMSFYDPNPTQGNKYRIFYHGGIDALHPADL
jgi:hypothetical protein